MAGVADAFLTPESLARVTADLVRIPSVNPSVAPDQGSGEAEVASFARDWLERNGVRAWLEEAAPGRPNCVAEVDGEPGPTLVLCAHLDTVGTAGMTIPSFDPVLRDGRLYGRGSYDMKGSAAAILCALASLAQVRQRRGRVLAALVADEEYASIGAEHFVRHHPTDACIVTEASAGDLVLAHKGYLWADLTTRGRAAHGSRWDLGESAIASMARVVTALDRFDREVLRSRTHPLTGPASLHVSMIQGGVGLSTYAPECRAQLERRTIPGEREDDVVAELEAVARGAGVVAELHPRFHRPPLTCPADSPIARCVREAATRVRGVPPREIGVGYWMDAALFAAAGVPTVNIGPAGEGAHAAEEWVDVASLVICARTLVECARGFADHLGGPAAA